MNTIKQQWEDFQSKSVFIALILLLLLIAVFLGDTNFFTITNISNIFLKAARNGGLLALGMTFVILTGEIDLSLGSLMALSGVVAGLVGQYNQVLGLTAGVLTGVISGAILGFIVTKMKLSSWVASLAMLFGLRGLILVLSRESVSLDGRILEFARTQVLAGVIPSMPSGISLLIILFIIITLVCIFIAKYTSFGLQLYSVGGNEEGAEMMGVNIDKVKIKAFMMSGLLSAISGVLLASSSGSATLSAGNMYETIAIAMCAIGGIQLSGGVGRFAGTFFGILIYFMLQTIFTYIPSVTTHWQTLIMGVLVLISVTMQSETLTLMNLKKLWGDR
ncbi:MAG: ABC transporter permease [Staphylococcus equorum]|nr:ABC transporter permease [Staphylococcus equorum]